MSVRNETWKAQETTDLVGSNRTITVTVTIDVEFVPS